MNVVSLLRDIEAGALYLLTSTDHFLRTKAVEALRVTPVLFGHFLPPTEVEEFKYKKILDILSETGLDEVSLPHQNLKLEKQAQAGFLHMLEQ